MQIMLNKCSRLRANLFYKVKHQNRVLNFYTFLSEKLLQQGNNKRLYVLCTLKNGNKIATEMM